MAWKPTIREQNRLKVDAQLRHSGVRLRFSDLRDVTYQADNCLTHLGISERHRVGCAYVFSDPDVNAIEGREDGRVDVIKIVRMPDGWIVAGAKSVPAHLREAVSFGVTLTPGAKAAAIAHAAKEFSGQPGKLPADLVNSKITASS